jgi:hypothetical protein
MSTGVLPQQAIPAGPCQVPIIKVTLAEEENTENCPLLGPERAKTSQGQQGQPNASEYFEWQNLLYNTNNTFGLFFL